MTCHRLPNSHRHFLTVVVMTGVLVLNMVCVETAAEGSNACTLARQTCDLACSRQHNFDSASHAGCVVRCGAEAASCEAAAGLSAARPWLERQMERLRQFYDGFMGEEESDLPSLPPEQAAPSDGETEETEQGIPEMQSDRNHFTICESMPILLTPQQHVKKCWVWNSVTSCQCLE